MGIVCEESLSLLEPIRRVLRHSSFGLADEVEVLSVMLAECCFKRLNRGQM